MKKAQAILSLILLFSLSEVKAQTPEYFNNAYDYQNQLQLAFNVLQLKDSTYLTLGVTIDFLNSGSIGPIFSWYDNSGFLDSQKSCLSPGIDKYIGEPGSFYKDKAGGYFFGGSTNKTPDTAQYLSYGLLIRYNDLGDTLFTKTYGDSSKFQGFYGSYQLHDSGYVLVGIQQDFSNFYEDYYVVRTDKAGNLIWQKNFDGGFDFDVAIKVLELTNHDIVIGGGREFTNDIFQPWVIVVDSDGNFISDKKFIGSLKCGGARITPSKNDHMIMWGCLDTIVTMGDYEYPRYIGRIKPDLNFVWKTIFNDTFAIIIRNAKEFSDGSVIGVGDIIDSLGNDIGWVVKLDSSGNKIWEHTYQFQTSFFNELEDVIQTHDKGYLICGTTMNNFNNQDLWLIKVDSNGCLVPDCIINTGTIEINGSSVSFEVYPNPAQDAATISLSIPQSVKDACLIIFDVNGRLLTRINTPVSGEYRIDSNRWPSGMYFCNLMGNGISQMTRKLLIQK